MHNVVLVHVPCSLKMTPYFFYSWAMPADQQPGEDKYYRHLVTRWLVRDATYKQVEPTAQEISDYTEDFSKCISAAITLGFKHILISPMVCDSKGWGCCCVGCRGSSLQSYHHQPAHITPHYSPLHRRLCAILVGGAEAIMSAAAQPV
jgi:hypothetical protein